LSSRGYRVIARIEDERITILVVRVATGGRCIGEVGY
jgi:mRNA-degrading endonuclease RelE of RelBE toxin-antitoxin system